MAYFPEDNYLFAEAVLLDRLKELFPSGVHMDSLGDVRELIQGNALFPCACVGYLGDKPIALEWSLDTGKLTLIKQHVGSIVGDNSTKDFPITHGFNTRAVTVDLHDAATYKTVYADVARTSDNAVTVTLDPAPQAGEDYVAIIRAEV